MAPPTSDSSFIDVAIDEYTSRLRDLMETLSMARKQLRDLGGCQDAMCGTLTNVGAVLAQQPPTEGTENALNRLAWFLRSTRETEKALGTLLDTHRETVPMLVAQERIATNLLTSANAVLQGPLEETPEPRRNAPTRPTNPSRLFLVTG